MSLTDQKHGTVANIREYVFRYFLLLSCACLMIQIFSIPYRIYALTSLSNKALLFSWFILGCYVLVAQFCERVTMPFVCLLFITLMSLLSFGIATVFQTETSSAFSTVLGFLMLPTMLYCIKSWGISYQTKKLVLLCNLGMSFQYIWLYHSPLSHIYKGSHATVNISSVTLGFHNPNQTATMLFVCLLLLFTAYFFFEGKKTRALIAVDFLYVAYIMLKTDSRTSALLLFVFIALSLFAFKKRLPRFVTDFSLIAPIVYIILAVAFISLLNFIQIAGDNIFTGREDIYAKYFNNLNVATFLFGDYAKFQFENLHNGYISIAATVGIVVFMAYYLFLRKVLFDAFEKLVHKYEFASYCGLLCLIVYTCTEAGFFVGGAMYAFLIAIVFVMMPSDGEPIKAEREKQPIEGSDQ